MNEFIDLYYQGGGSDKVYQASLEGTNNAGYIVRFAFGRRGAFLKEGTKTSSPLPYPEAKEVYDELVRSKEAKGYSKGPHYNNGIHPPVATAPTATKASKAVSVPVASIPKVAKKQSVNSATNFSGITPQLLNFIEEDKALELLEDDNYIAQEKKDGKRTMVLTENRVAKGINKKGSNIGLAQGICEEAAKSPEDLLLDGEDVNCKLWAFDILKRGDDDLRKLPYSDRFKQLQEVVLFYFDGEDIEIVRSASTTKDKKALFETLKSEGAEGIVFKRANAVYTPGRPNTGGDQLKYKFYETASVLVSSQNNKRSVAFQVLDGKNWIDVGNVTIPPNRDIPKDNTVIEVRYLYAYPGGSLFQVVYLGERDDVDKDECTIDQLKYKQETL